MEILVDVTIRAILALGVNLAAQPGQLVEPIDTATLAAIQTAEATVSGDGSVSISADHQTLTINPPSAGYLATQAQIAAAKALRAQHRAALGALYANATANSAQITSDLAALATIVSALQAGTQPTAAQQVIIDRVLCRLLIVLAG